MRLDDCMSGGWTCTALPTIVGSHTLFIRKLLQWKYLTGSGGIPPPNGLAISGAPLPCPLERLVIRVCRRIALLVRGHGRCLSCSRVEAVRTARWPRPQSGR